MYSTPEYCQVATESILCNNTVGMSKLLKPLSWMQKINCKDLFKA